MRDRDLTAGQRIIIQLIPEHVRYLTIVVIGYKFSSLSTLRRISPWKE